MKHAEVEALVTKLVEPLLADTELTLADVEYVREKDWYLRVYIDKPGGVEIDDCQLVSERLEAVLDAQDPIPDKYILEVSSPGIDRPLKKDEEYVAHYGSKVDVSFFAPQGGARDWVAVLDAHTQDTVTLRRIDKNITAKTPVVLERKLIASVRPHIDF